MSKTGLCPPLLQASPRLYMPPLINVHPQPDLAKLLTDPQVHTTFAGPLLFPVSRTSPLPWGFRLQDSLPLTTRESLALPSLGPHGSWYVASLENNHLIMEWSGYSSTFTSDCEFPAGRTCHFIVSSQALGTLSYTE